MGGVALKDKGTAQQLLGCVIGSVAIFLPSALLVLFFFPIWHNIKKYAVVYRALEGINAVVVGIMIAAAFYMMKDIAVVGWKDFFLALMVLVATWLLLTYSKLPSPVIVAICLFLGWVL
jgi:chromate transporter